MSPAGASPDDIRGLRDRDGAGSTTLPRLVEPRPPAALAPARAPEGRPIRPMTPARLRAKLARARALHATLLATGLWWLMDLTTRPGKRVELTRHTVLA